MSEATTEMQEQQRGGEQTERQRKLRQAYGTATSRLREAHRTEFDELYSLEAQALGVDYRPKPTAEQKAEQDLRELLEKHPHLADRVSEFQQEREQDPQDDVTQEDEPTNI